MNLRFVSAAAVALILAACATKPVEEEAAPPPPPPPPPPPAAPSGPAADSLEYFNTVVGNTVNFDFDKYDLRPDAQAALRAQAAWLNQNPSRTVTVEGHCDERGTREYNLGLGERRANAAKQYLITLGIAESRLKTISYGKERPLCVESSEACWQNNRRGTSVAQ
ncbi:MAG: peptidoglycan-associated lipoprotein [Candidatus Marinimicrobia bacterium]|nr:peptidoglycan-associated lipoprotein [Candidatus Neomarinimicrobiota bacterium]